jgi:hypothetical protein
MPLLCGGHHCNSSAGAAAAAAAAAAALAGSYAECAGCRGSLWCLVMAVRRRSPHSARCPTWARTGLSTLPALCLCRYRRQVVGGGSARWPLRRAALPWGARCLACSGEVGVALANDLAGCCAWDLAGCAGRMMGWPMGWPDEGHLAKKHRKHVESRPSMRVRLRSLDSRGRGRTSTVRQFDTVQRSTWLRSPPEAESVKPRNAACCMLHAAAATGCCCWCVLLLPLPRALAPLRPCPPLAGAGT